jgi:hypothetical protein
MWIFSGGRGQSLVSLQKIVAVLPRLELGGEQDYGPIRIQP